MVGHYYILVCGLSGEVSLQNYDEDDTESKQPSLRFKLNLEEREMISFVKKTNLEKYVIFATSKEGKFHRLMIYKYNLSVLEYNCEWSMNEATKGVDSDKLLHTIEAGLNDMEGNIILAGIEQGYGAGIRIWRLDSTTGTINEVGYRREFFIEKYVDSQVHMNMLWTLEESGYLKSTHVTRLIEN